MVLSFDTRFALLSCRGFYFDFCFLTFFNSASTFSAVIGKSNIRAPTASSTAFAICGRRRGGGDFSYPLGPERTRAISRLDQVCRKRGISYFSTCVVVLPFVVKAM